MGSCRAAALVFSFGTTPAKVDQNLETCLKTSVSRGLDSLRHGLVQPEPPRDGIASDRVISIESAAGESRWGPTGTKRIRGYDGRASVSRAAIDSSPPGRTPSPRGAAK